MRVPNFFIKTDREKEAIKKAKSEFKQECINKFGKNYKPILKKSTRTFTLTH